VFTPQRISLTATLVTVLLACGMTSAAIAQQDLRMPDTRDAATAAIEKQDLRGADAQDAARADQIAAQMRSFKPAPLAVPKPAPASAPSDGTPWAIIGISLFGALVAVGGAVLYVRLPRRNTLARS
jgi:hypothetical protein